MRALRDILGLKVEVAKPTTKGPGTGAVLHFSGTRVEVALETTENLTVEDAQQLVELENSVRAAEPILLVAERADPRAREILAGRGISAVDGSGNTHIELPGLLIHVETGAQPQVSDKTTVRFKFKAGIVAQALLAEPDRKWRLRELAEETGISVKTVQNALNRLDRIGIAVTEGRNFGRVRSIADLGALIDIWVDENVDRVTKTSGHIADADSPQGLIEKVRAGLGDSGFAYALTGPAAASMFTPAADEGWPTASLWVDSKVDPGEVLEAVGARRDVPSRSNFTVLHEKNDVPVAFREKKDGVWVVKPFRLYLDLLRDPQVSPERAEAFRRQILGY